MYTLNKRELILCHVCQGDGILIDVEQRGPYTEQTVSICTHCNGYGREYRITKITYEPFKKEQL